MASTADSKAASDLSSPTDSVIAGDFGSLTAAEQERQRDEWKAELSKTEEEILTLRQVLASKESHAAGLKRRLGITAWREFSDDMQQGLKSLQESEAYKKTAEGIEVVKTKTASAWSSVATSQSFINMSQKMGSAFGAAKTKVSQSLSPQGGAAPATGAEDSKPEAKPEPAAANGEKNGQNGSAAADKPKGSKKDEKKK